MPKPKCMGFFFKRYVLLRSYKYFQESSLIFLILNFVKKKIFLIVKVINKLYLSIKAKIKLVNKEEDQTCL